MKDPVSASSARAKIYRISLSAMFLAFHVVLSLVPSVASWASLPVILCAFLIGPIDAIVVAVIGSFIEQLQYGINVTTLIWMLPWVIFGVFVGVCAYVIRKRERRWLVMLVIVLAELLLNVANTTAMLNLGYLTVESFSLAVLIPLYLLRMPHALIRAVLSAIVIPFLLPPLRRALAKLQR